MKYAHIMHMLLHMHACFMPCAFGTLLFHFTNTAKDMIAALHGSQEEGAKDFIWKDSHFGIHSCSRLAKCLLFMYDLYMSRKAITISKINATRASLAAYWASQMT